MGNQKPKRELLGQNGIEFSENEDDAWKPAAHIASLQAELLAFRDIVTSTQPQYTDTYPKIPDEGLLYPGTKETRNRFERALRIRDKSRNLKSGEEDLWRQLVQNKLFKNMGSHEKPKRPTALCSLKGAVAMNGPQTKWSEAANCRELPTQRQPTRPQPDIYFAIQVYSGLPSPMGGLNRAFHNLSFEALCAHKGLTCSPAKGLAKCKPIGEDEKHRVCFPFAMVELKHDIAKNTDKEFCYCQAANAASCALAMLCQLCQHTPNSMYWHDEHNEVLPVVTFTFIGNEAKVWLAYVSRYRCAENEGRFIHQYQMQCIWSGDLHILWEAAQLCSIVDRLAEWFLCTYRPWICAHLDQWKSLKALKKLEESYKLSSSERSIATAFKSHWERWLEEDDTEYETPEDDDRDQSGDYDDEVGSSGFVSWHNESSGIESVEIDTSESDEDRYERRNSTIGGRERSYLTPSLTWDASDEGPPSNRTRSRSAEPSVGSSPETPRLKGRLNLSPEMALASSVRPAAQSSKTSPSALALPTSHRRARSNSPGA